MNFRLSALAALLAVAVAAVAQPAAGTFSIIPRLGVSIAKVSGDNMHVSIGNDDISLTPSYKPGLMAGADVEYQFTDLFAASVGAYYSRQGQRYGDYTEAHDLSSRRWNEVRDFKQHHDYINIPVMASFYVGRNLALKAGLQVGINTSARMEYTCASITRSESGEGSTESVDKYKSDVAVKKTDFSIPVGISYEYMSVIIDARYNIGLTDVYKLDGIKGRNSVFTFNVGYRFTL